ncbi:MAG: hypothetical protein L3I99_00950 [Sulfurimonas sp.]|nr:hypothetical protein [Sulfurimonas sp.]
MLDNIIKDSDFANVMQKNMQDMILHFFSKEQNFGILCKIKDVEFSPELPEDIQNQFHQMTLFFLAGYTFETARIDDEYLVFEAGFGTDNFGSLVTVPLLSIMQIIIDETPVLINLAIYKKEIKEIKNEIKEKGIKNSMNSFLTNPENSKFLK